MHIIIILALVLGAIYLLSSKSNAEKNAKVDLVSKDGGDVSAECFPNIVAYISKGKLFYRTASGETQQIHSQYVQAMMDRVEKHKQLHGWKDGTAFGTSFTGQTQQPISDQIQIQVTSAQFIAEQKLVYFLVDDSFGGLFEYDISTQEEKRLIHKQRLHYLDLEINPQKTQLLCSQSSTTGVANITVLNVDGSANREITGGDTVDSSPAWIPDNLDQIVFQSLGLARNSAGYVIAHGPASIQLLNIESNQLTPVMEADHFDFLSPKVSSDGSLYFIRRPYEMPKYSGSSFISDFFLFPFRLLRAVFHYLNFFSLMYTRKPLTSASGPQVTADLKDIILKGKRIDAENALKSESPVNGVPSLVPKSWQLIRKQQGGQETVLATNVAAFNLTSDNKIIYSNGYGVFLLEGNETKIVLKDKLIADVIVN